MHYSQILDMSYQEYISSEEKYELLLKNVSESNLQWLRSQPCKTYSAFKKYVYDSNQKNQWWAPSQADLKKENLLKAIAYIDKLG